MQQNAAPCHRRGVVVFSEQPLTLIGAVFLWQQLRSAERVNGATT